MDYTTGIYPGAGIARYTRSLVGALAGMDGRNRYGLFYAGRGLPKGTPERGIAEELFRRHGNFRGVAVPLSVRQTFGLWQRLRAPLPVEIFTGRCDVVHSPDFVSPPHLWGADVITVHDLSFLVVPECAEPKLAAFLGRTVPSAVRRADHVLAVSEQTKSDLIRLLDVPPGKVTVAYNGVEARFRPFDEAELKGPGGHSGGGEWKIEIGCERFILHVGTLEPRKNLVRLVEAYGRLVSAKRVGDVALVLAGRKGWVYEPIHKAAERVNGAGGRVIFLDFVRDEHLPLLYNMATGFAYPSLYEGFGLPAAEALACGTPTLVSTDGALREVVGDAAVAVDPRSVEEIADGLERLLLDEGLRARLREQGPVQVARFTWEAAARKVLDVYEKVGA
ncbi:MAG: glycosyltransferase family 4 protein [Chloroflexia bacterium]